MAEKKVIEIEIQDNTKSLKAQYKEAVQEVQKLVQAYGEASEQVAEASKRAAKLKEQIEDTNDAIQAFKGEGAFIATGKAISSVASGFSAVEGAVALTGVESEKLQETMVRLQAAMALAQGLEGLEDAGRAFKQLGAVATNAFNGMTTATKVFLATGLGLLLAGLGTVIAYWDDVSQAVGLTNKAQDDYIEQQKQIAENSKKQAEFVAKESVEFVGLATRLKQTNEDSKERRDLIKQINKEYGTTLKNLSDEAEFQDQVNKMIGEYIEFQKAKYALQINEDLMRRNMEKQFKIQADIARQEEKIEKSKRLQAVDEKIRELSNQKLLNGNYKIQDELSKLEKERQQLHNENVSNLTTETHILNQLNAELETTKKRFEGYAGSANKAGEKVDKLTYNGKRFVENLDNQKKDVKDATGVVLDSYAMQQAVLAELNAEELKSLENAEKSKTTAIDVSNQIMQQRTRELEHDKYVAEEQRRIDEETVQRRKRNVEFTAEAIAQTFAIIAQLTQANDKMSEKQARRAFNINKMAQIGQATATTYLSATKAYASQIIPGDPTSVVRGQVAAGIAIASGLANVAMIARQQFNAPSTSGGGSSMSSGGGIVAPNLNVVGDTGINQLAQLGQTPIKAYVVSNDVTTAQMFDLKVQQTASL